MPRLPPVLMSPQARLRARLVPGVICSVVTFFQSHSSSSATSWARPVIVPWPISERAMRITQVSSGLMATHTLSSEPPLAATPCAIAAPNPDGRLNPERESPSGGGGADDEFAARKLRGFVADDLVHDGPLQVLDVSLAAMWTAVRTR